MPKPIDKPGGGKKNKSPNIVDQPFSIDENTVDGSAVGPVVASDPEDDTLTYSIVSGNVGGAFAIASIIIIGTTVRMAVLHRSTEIAIMRLVGATDGFIRRPFLLEGTIKGTLGGTGVIALNYGAYAAIDPLFSSSFFTLNQSLVLVLFGTVLGFLASAMSVGRHLKSVNPA